MNPRFWLNLQTEYDVRIATREVTAKIAVGRMGNLPQRSARFLHTPSPLGHSAVTVPPTHVAERASGSRSDLLRLRLPMTQ